MEHVRISPRYLGLMNTPKFCDRCYWYLIELGFHPPFPCPMPGLMYNLDRFEKGLVQAHLAEHDELPKWLADLDCIGIAEFPRKMTLDFPEYDITMVGMPDEVFLNKDGRLVLVDYKSAKFQGDQDEFMPIYEAQLLGYLWLLEENKIGTVDSAALIYFQNQLNDYESRPLDLLTKDGFKVPFNVMIHEVEIDRDELPKLLKRFREYADLKFPPKGNPKCKFCGPMQRMLDAEFNRRSKEDYARQRDGLSRQHSRQLEAERELARAAGPQNQTIRHEDMDWVLDCPDCSNDLD